MGVEVGKLLGRCNREVVRATPAQKPKRWWPRAAVLTTIIDVLVGSFLSSNVPNVSTGTELVKFKFNIVKNKSLEAMFLSELSAVGWT